MESRTELDVLSKSLKFATRYECLYFVQVFFKHGTKITLWLGKKEKSKSQGKLLGGSCNNVEGIVWPSFYEIVSVF